MDTCTNVPDMCRKEKQRVQEGGAGRGWCHLKGDSVWKQVNSVRLGLFAVKHTSATGGDCSTADDLHPPVGKQKHFHQSSDTQDATKQQQQHLVNTGANDKASVPLKRIFALCSEIIDVGLEMQFEDVVLVDVFGLWGDGDWVTQQRKAGQWIIIL